MAGHFILKNITTSDLHMAIGPVLQATWSAPAHLNVGWTDQSRGVLQTALSGGAIANRNFIPPHSYLMIPHVVGQKGREMYLRGCGWGELLERPSSVGLGLRALTPKAALAFAQGDTNGALALQALHGGVSIETYYLAKTEIAGDRAMSEPLKRDVETSLPKATWKQV